MTASRLHEARSDRPRGEATTPDRETLHRSFVVVGLTSAVAFVALAVVATNRLPSSFDRAVANVLMTSSDTSVWFRLARVASHGGSPSFVVLAAAALALVVWWQRRDLRLVALCLVAPAVAGILQLATKELLGPTPPVWINPYYPGRALLFPSGHATGAAAIASLVIVIAMTSPIACWARRAIFVLALGYAFAVATSRVIIDDHLATQSIAGVLLGTAVVALGAVFALPRATARRVAR